MAPDIAISIDGVWKIFGSRAQEAFEAIRREGLSKKAVAERFGCVVGVADASFEVERGEIFCVMGLSGSGKSTLVRHVNRLLEPTAGRIKVGDADVMAMDEAALREFRNHQVAMVFQSFGLLPHRTVRDNVAIPLEIRGASKAERWREADRVIAMVELTGWEDRYAHELSGGMQQRVGLARAIAANPLILLMDEPFSALDPLIRRQLQDQFMALSKVMKKTTIFITHDLDEAIRIGHRIAIMKDGRIVQIGRPEQIVLNPADEYVAEFVAGISRLKLVRAASLMRPLPSNAESAAALLAHAPRVMAEQDLSTLIDVSIEHDGPLLVTSADGTPSGLVERVDLLRALQGRPRAEAAAA
ncbi:MAG: betaine/proline/choline family ABC transporter ATP-binding protein [Rubrivivax sp.]|nr:betaine/proline/choline family ABC transporter ATP-binding protein [Rubrivivax sp.]